jgi:hypothetical protein
MKLTLTLELMEKIKQIKICFCENEGKIKMKTLHSNHHFFYGLKNNKVSFFYHFLELFLLLAIIFIAFSRFNFVFIA